MEKLLNLLQEFYGENRKFSNDNGLLIMTNGVENLKGAYAQTYIISLQGGFIKWLVEGDKIDEKKVKKAAYYYWTDEYDVYEGDVFYHRLLMMLAVSNNPISDLISFLKTDD